MVNILFAKYIAQIQPVKITLLLHIVNQMCKKCKQISNQTCQQHSESSPSSCKGFPEKSDFQIILREIGRKLYISY